MSQKPVTKVQESVLDESIGTWECKLCGECCKHLFRSNSSNSSNGLFLFPNEVELFPSETIRPFFGIKIKDVIEPLCYLMTTNPCPNLIDNRCGIHETKPKLCESWPFMFLNGVFLQVDCPNSSSSPKIVLSQKIAKLEKIKNALGYQAMFETLMHEFGRRGSILFFDIEDSWISMSDFWELRRPIKLGGDR